MNISPAIVAGLALALGATIHDGSIRTQPLLPSPNTAVLATAGSQPEILVSVGQSASSKGSAMEGSTRLEIIRYVDGEFVKALKPLPAGKKGLKFNPTKPFDQKGLTKSLQSQGAAIQPGDTVQITNIEFRAKEIIIDLNGGGEKHFHLLQHIQVGVGGEPSGPSPAVNSQEGTGATLYLEYGRDLPDMTADDLKQQLSTLLDFSKHSAAVNWVDTLPPEFKQAIQDRRAVVGMDHEMVLAAMGRPDHKVRERDPQGDETEDWIYGDPPGRTVFVTFEGDKVIRVKDFE
ncbi:MAG TPA: hypothetical protein VMU43_03700 [Candidatus Acidoferrum sp.]|nr:hypothetical protein [Candidatus Acidoferrum sp.]